MSEDKPFKIDIGGLRSKPKDTAPARIAATDAAGEEHGFVARQAVGRRGRLPSPRTGQIHAKVYPNVSDEIADEAQRRGVTQGVIIEEAWAMYQNTDRR